MKINFFSTFDCLVKINESEFEPFDFGETLFLDKDFFAYVYPLSGDRASLSYTAKFEIKNNKINCLNKNIKIINFNEYCEITFNEQLLEISDNAPFCIDEQNYNFNGKNYTLSIFNGGKNNINFKSNVLLFSDTVPELKTCNISQFNNLIVINVVTKKAQNIFVINLETENLIFKKQVAKIEISLEENKIYLLDELKDSLNHAMVEIYDLNQNFILVDSYPTYLSENGGHVKEINDFVFFDAIKAKNYKLARSFLTSSISSKLSDDQLYNYFVNFKEIRQSNFNNKYYLIPYGNVVTASIFEFEKDQNLINNITC